MFGLRMSGLIFIQISKYPDNRIVADTKLRSTVAEGNDRRDTFIEQVKRAREPVAHKKMASDRQEWSGRDANPPTGSGVYFSEYFGKQ